MKNALVTGADRGLGYSIAKTLASHGYNICINYLKEKNKISDLCERLQDEYKCLALGFQADVCNNFELQKMFSFFEQSFGGLDLLINNAGITKFSPFLKTTEELWKQIVSTDFKGAFFCAQMAAKNMVAHKIQGLIINISSNQAERCWPDASVYGPAKAALSKMGRNIAMELAPYGIRVITLELGYINTGWKKSQVLENARKKIPLQRFALPDEIAKIILHLASDDFTYVTGCNITIDGGALLPVITENQYDFYGENYE